MRLCLNRANNVIMQKLLCYIFFPVEAHKSPMGMHIITVMQNGFNKIK